MSLQFDLPKEQSSIIKVIGVGGGGSNAVNHMYEMGIRGVNYVVCNTDQQALDLSPIPNKIQLGPEITQGLGAGSRPEVGEQATIESARDIQEILSKNTKMVFVTAGMGGGTGTGGAPIVAKIAREMGILTVGIVTTPFSFEGRRKLKQADEGIKRLKEEVDSILIISNDKIREIFGNLTKSEAFSRADDVLTMAAKSISEIITVPGEINVDFADVQYVMKSSGVAIMGVAQAEGEDRAMRAVHAAINSPLLNNNNITGARNILINISSGNSQVTIDEITNINDFVQDAAGNDTDIIFGTCDDEALGDKISVTIIATGFEPEGDNTPVERTREVINLTTPTTSTPIANTTEVKKEDEFKLIDKSEKPSSENTVNTPPFNEIKNEVSETYTFELFEDKKEEEINETPISSDDEFATSFSDDDSNNENTYEFEIKNIEPEKKEEYGFYTSSSKDEKNNSVHSNNVSTEQENILKERVRRLKDVSYKWDNMSKIKELEDIPAYERRGVNLDKIPHSSDQDTSNFTVENFKIDGEDRTEIKRNNYLDPRVD